MAHATCIDQIDGATVDNPELVSPHDYRRVLTAKSLRRMLQITEGITANIFHTINTLAIEAIESGREQITNEAIEKWKPEFDAEAAFA
ncbi:hypothetical protein [Sinorhizobium meliloti]|uniref:hypothetical protein n=2 Tax=Rhizobium meliloti TaxID=382 RepID=UPI001F3286B1|nr:hypothetical protein [Sinorhizobium meliloti]